MATSSIFHDFVVDDAEGEEWKKNVVYFSPSEGESATFTPLDTSEIDTSEKK